MKFAIFSDIHANLEGLDAVLADAATQGATEYVCCGDIVGSNSNPAECVHRLRELGCPVVKGDFDEEASTDTDLAGLNPAARAAFAWTRRALSPEDKAWLRALSMVREIRGFTIVHSSLDAPTSWAYVMNRFDAMASFPYQFTRICFFGHTHTPKVFIKGHTVTLGNTEYTRLEPSLKYFINVGSVGQPRDGDWRSAYALYDHENQEISIRRVPYDIGTTRRKNRAAGLE